MNTLFDALFAPLARRSDPLLILPEGGTITGQEFLALVARQARTTPEGLRYALGNRTDGSGWKRPRAGWPTGPSRWHRTSTSSTARARWRPRRWATR